MMAAGEAPWRRRFWTARVTLPVWARDQPERLLYATNAGGRWDLVAWDRRTDTHRRLTDRPDGTSWGRIEPSGARVWWFDDRKGDERGVWVARPFALEVDEPPRPVAGDLPHAYAAGLAFGEGEAFAGLSAEDGSTVWRVKAGETAQLLYQHRESATVGAASRDGALFALSHSEHGDSRHPAVRVLTPNGETVSELWDGPERGLWPGAWSLVPGDARLLLSHERGDMHRPLIWSPRTGEQHELPLDLPGEVSASWYPDGGSLLLVHDHRGRGELYRYTIATGATEQIATEPGVINGAAVRPDGEVWCGWTRSSTPSEVRAGDRVLLRPEGEPAPAGVAYARHQIGDVSVYVAEPAGSRPHPTLFWIHGGPAAHDQDAFSPRVQAFVDHGMAVLMVNYRGSSGHGRAWRDALQGNPGLTELADIARVHDWAVSSGLADSGRIVLGGGSWGGYLTLLGLGVQPDLWAAGLAIVPVADYIAAYEDEMEPLKAFDRALFGGSPEEIPDLYRERSPLTYVERVRVPLLILAGENDPRCPIRQIDNYIARLHGLGRPPEVYRFDTGHGSLVVDEEIRQYERMIAFLASVLGTRPPI